MYSMRTYLMNLKDILHLLTFNLDRHVKHAMVRYYNRRLRDSQFAYIREQHPKLDGVSCPVCGSDDCRPIRYYFEKCNIEKSFCSKCAHLWAVADLPNDVKRAVTMFDYEAPSLWCSTEKRLILSLIRLNMRPRGRFLDFGIGGNISVLEELAPLLKNDQKLFACDIILRNDYPNYFVTYKDDTKIGTFDGICSSEVIEHLDKTVETWMYMNRLLKPVSDGGGVMLHSFPSNVNLHMDDTMIVIGSHVCLFSEKSLRMLCEKSGFELSKISYRHFLPEFIFQKTRDV